MVDIPDGKIVAPYVGTVSVDQPTPSFSGYFLRDLHKQGRLNTEVVRRVVEEHGAGSTYEEIMAAITDHRGSSITEEIARALDTVASVGANTN